MTNTAILKGSRVSLHFRLTLDDGNEVDSTFDSKPASFVVGDGNLPVGFEETLEGMSAGEEKSTTILPEKAFGMPNPNNIQRLPRSQFAQDVSLEEGLVMSFSDAANTELPGVIRSFDEQVVEVDFNHPLAGRSLIFEVRILSVES
ncbi:peptidylprolyl isomerase [Endozoicomonas sp. (ex Bugula neritina AB1)]|nr:peptidylprolyl isomerase [Endozoicomonas sp. (ex Bugula neritina AB1)]